MKLAAPAPSDRQRMWARLYWRIFRRRQNAVISLREWMALRKPLAAARAFAGMDAIAMECA